MKSRKKVLYTATSYLPAIGGAQAHTHQCAMTLRDSYDFKAVCLWSENRTDWLLGTTIFAHDKTVSYEIDGLPVTRIGFSLVEKARMAPAAGFYFALEDLAIKRISRVIFDKIHPHASDVSLLHHSRIGREPISYASLRIARDAGIPFVLTPFHHPRWSGWFHRHFLDLYREADALIALTEAEKELLVKLGCEEERIFVTGMGPLLSDHAQPEQFIGAQSIRPGDPIILFLGQHFEYKGYKLVLAAASQVWRKIPTAQFVFIGPAVGGSERAFKAIADPRIHRLGIVDLQKKTDALAACTILCVPSTQESFGGVYTEAWSMGKPVIGCPIPSVSEVVDHEKDGLLVEPHAAEVAEAIQQLLLHPEEARSLGEQGREKVVSKYTWDRIAGIVAKAYERILH